MSGICGPRSKVLGRICRRTDGAVTQAVGGKHVEDRLGVTLGPVPPQLSAPPAGPSTPFAVRSIRFP